MQIRIKKLIHQYLLNRGIILQRFGREHDLNKYFENEYKQAFSFDSLKQRRFYNVGAGRFRHKYWTNIDLRLGSLSGQWENHDIDYNLSQKKSFPIESNSAELIYSSHVVEHVSNDAVLHFLEEAQRVLRPGGVIRLTCPDIDLALRAYKSKDESFFYCEDIPSLEYGLIRFFATELVHEISSNYLKDNDIVNLLNESNMGEYFLDTVLNKCSLIYQAKNPDNHINWFNQNKLVKILCQAGFKNIYRSGYGQSSIPVLRDIRYFDSTLPLVSL